MMKLVGGRAVIVAGFALAAGRAEADRPAIHDLPVTPMDISLEAKGQNIGSIRYFRVVAATSVLTGQLNHLIADSAGALGVLDSLQSAHPRDTLQITCEIGIANDAFVSWKCVRFMAHGPWSGGSVAITTTFAYYIDHDQLREATLAQLCAPRRDLVAQLVALEGARPSSTSFGGGSEVCHVDPGAAMPFVTLDGIDFQDEYNSHRCSLSWDALAPLLAADSPATRLAADLPDEVRPRPSLAWGKAAPRFVALPAPDDAVLDKVTGLVWAVHDNGADIAWQAATAYAKAYRGGGHADWRLPTEAELERLAEPEMAHRERGDCTRGKLDVMVSALLHPSCGLAWTSTPIGGDRAVAFGLISATSRIARRSDTRNHRALVVRDPNPPPPPAAPARPAPARPAPGQGSSARSGGT